MGEKHFSGQELDEAENLLLTDPFTVNEVLGIAECVRAAYIRKNIPPVHECVSESLEPYLKELNESFDSPIFKNSCININMSCLGSSYVKHVSFGIDLRKLLLLREAMIHPDERDKLAWMLHDDTYSAAETSFDLAIVGHGWMGKLFRRKQTDKLKELIRLEAQLAELSYKKYREHISGAYPSLFEQVESFEWGSVGAKLNEPEPREGRDEMSHVRSYMDCMFGDTIYFDVCNLYFDHKTGSPNGYSKFNPKLELSLESPHKINNTLMTILMQ